jgi:hypothetical protein
MAQATDYSIANQSGANFRAELNTILAAIVSQNSGSTAPSTTYAYQWWIDTGVTPALLKIRNAANSAWITVGDVTAANLGLLSAATAASTYALIASPTFTGTVTIPSGALIDGYLTTSTASSTYLALAGGTLTGNVTLNGQSDLRFGDLDSSNWVAFQAPASVSTNVTWTLPAADGTSGQVLQTNGSGTLSWVTGGSGDVTLTGTQTLTNKTLTDPAIIGTILEDVFTITDGAAFEIDPGNGSIQLITLGASRTPKATNFAAGEAVTLMVDDGTAYTLTWSDSTFGGSGVVWKTNAGAAPTLNTSGYTVITLWKVGTQVYGARVGDA